MTTKRVLMGTVRGGVIVPEEDALLSEGMQVEILLSPVSPLANGAASDIWQQAHRESSALAAKWEREPRDANGWPRSFLEDTYGSLADDPLERLPQGEPEVREAID